MISVSTFLITILKDVLEKPIVSNDYDDYGISRNSFSYYAKYNKPLSKKVARALRQITLETICNDKEKETEVKNFAVNFLTDKEKQAAKNTHEIVKIAISKFTKSSHKGIKNITFISNEEIETGIYAKKATRLFDKFCYYFEKDIDTARMYATNIVDTICNTILSLKKITVTNKNEIETLSTFKIVPENIAESMNHVKKSMLEINNHDKTKLYCLNLKIVIKWFINQYLKNDKYKIADDYLYKNHGLGIRAVHIDELLKMGWSVEKYIIECFKMWDSVFEECVPDEHRGTIDQWVKIVKHSPDTQRAILNKNNEFIGSWSIKPLFDDVYLKAKAGDFVTGDFTVNVIPVMLPGNYNIYVGVCLKEDYRNTFAVQRLIFSIVSVIEELALNGIFINEICAWAYTNDGISLCKTIGLKYLLDHKEHGEIYCGTMKNLLEQPICSNFKTLKTLYEQHIPELHNGHQ